MINNAFDRNITILIIFLSAFCMSCKSQVTSFKTSETKEGILITENGKKVLFYQREPKSLNGEYVRNNYIHPLYNLDGDTLTLDFPEDHPFHRGVFWAWHHVSINDSIISDPWTCINHNCNVVNASTSFQESNIAINIEALWSSPKYLNDTPYLEEKTEITVHPQNEETRIIDFKISLLALTKGLKIGGSNDQKGYGGFCMHIVTPEDLVFVSDSGKVTPQELQISAGPWMDFSGTFGKESGVSGITLLCSKNNPNYPQPWILRQKRSMQNVVYPGREPVEVSTKKPIVLNYRIVIHNEGANVEKIAAWENDYKKVVD